MKETIARLHAAGTARIESAAGLEELEKARKYLIGSYALNFDTSTKIAGNLVSMQVEDYPVEYLDQRNGMIAAVDMISNPAR